MKKSFKQKVSLVLAGAMTLSSVMVNTSIANAADSVTTGVASKTTNNDGSYSINWDMKKIYDATVQEEGVVSGLQEGAIAKWFAGGVQDEFGLELGEGFTLTAAGASGTWSKMVGKEEDGTLGDNVTANFPDLADKANRYWFAGAENPKYYDEAGAKWVNANPGATPEPTPAPTKYAFLKFTAPDDLTDAGTLEVVMKVNKVGSSGKPTVGWIADKDNSEKVTFANESTTDNILTYLSCDEIEAGETYYIYVASSKARFVGLRFTAAGSGEESTEASTEASTEGSTEASTEGSTEGSTEASTEGSTEASTEASTDAVATPAAANVEYFTKGEPAGSEAPASFDGVDFELVPDNDVEKIDAGETFNVKLNVANNKDGITALLIRPQFDEKIAKLTGVEVNTDICSDCPGDRVLKEINDSGSFLFGDKEDPIDAGKNGTWMTFTFEKVSNGDFELFVDTKSDPTTGSYVDVTNIDLGDYVVKGCVVKLEDAEKKEESTDASTEESSEVSTEASTEASTAASTENTTKESTTETTTNNTTETTTRKSSSGGGGGGGGSSSRASSNNDALKATTSGTKTENNGTSNNGNNGTNNTAANAPKFTAPNGTVIAPPTQAVYSKTFNDLTGRDWAASAINKLASLGIINGVAEGSFDPDAGSKRADFIIMLDKILGLSGYSTDNFDDVDSSKYYANYVGLAKQAGVATGYGDGNFGPEKSLTRQDMMVLVAKTLEFCGEDISADTSVLDQFDDAADMADYAKPFAAYLVSQGMVNGTGSSIEGTKDMTRAQMAVLMNKLYDKIYEIALANYNAEQAAAAEAEEAEEATEAESVEENTEETSESASEESTSEESTEEVTEETTEAQ